MAGRRQSRGARFVPLTITLLVALATTPSHACVTNADCTGGQVCIAGACQPCSADAECSNNDVCDGLETCVAGACQPGTPLNCDDGNVCTTDTCDPVAGCQHAPVFDGTSCADGDVCNGAETCQAGTCTPGTPLNCNDSNVCTTDTCDPVAGCQHTPVAVHGRHAARLQRQQRLYRRHV